jgi:NNP family nitrate/nitrite transporter-like MFS transporter
VGPAVAARRAFQAISALTTVKLTAHLGIRAPFLVVAAVLAAYGVVAAVVLRDAPGRPVPAQPALSRLAATVRLPITWQASALYAVGFGGFVAFSVYLPTISRTPTCSPRPTPRTRWPASYCLPC